MNNQVLCIVQARIGSSRLPGKVLMKVRGKTILEHVVFRLRRAEKIGKIVIATGDHPGNYKICDQAKKIDVECFVGPEKDVLSRYKQCSDKYPEFETIVRITADCPLIDPKLVDKVITFFQTKEFEYASNVNPATFPDGMDVEVISRKALIEADLNAVSEAEREHVTPYIRESRRFKTGNFECDTDYSGVRLTLDREEDLRVISELAGKMPEDAGFEDYVRYLERHPEISAINAGIPRNEKFKNEVQ